MFFVLKSFAYFISYLPNGVLVGGSHLLTFIAYDLLGIRKKILLKNLDIAYGSSLDTKQKKQIARQSFLHFFFTVFELLKSIRVPLSSQLKIIGKDYAEESAAAEKGVFILLFHMGNWEVLGGAFSAMRANSPGVVKPVGSPAVNKLVQYIREKNGMQSLYRDNNIEILREIIRQIKRGSFVGFPMDQFRPGDIEVDFFGKKTATNSGLAILARKFGCEVLVSYCIRRSFFNFELYIQPPLELQKTATSKDDIAANTLLFNQEMEKVIVKHPEQYMWLHNRWK